METNSPAFPSSLCKNRRFKRPERKEESKQARKKESNCFSKAQANVTGSFDGACKSYRKQARERRGATEAANTSQGISNRDQAAFKGLSTFQMMAIMPKTGLQQALKWIKAEDEEGGKVWQIHQRRNYFWNSDLS